MSLNRNTLKNDIIATLTNMLARDETSIEEFAERLSLSVDTYVKAAEIVYTNGLLAPNGAVTGVFNGKLQ